MSKIDEYFERAGQFGGSTFDPIEYPEEVTLKKDVPNVLRFVNFSDTGVKRIREAWCLCDDNKMRSFVIETEHEGPSLLMQMLGDLEHFGKGGYLESIKKEDPNGGKATSYPIHKDADQMLYLRIAKNGDESGKSGSWRGSDVFVTNVIQRWADIKDGLQIFWCKENKHTKLLKIKSQAFASIKAMIANDGAPEMYDVNYFKSGDGTNTKHSIIKAGNMVTGVVVGELTPEEKAYTQYVLTKDIKNSASLYVLKYLRSAIEGVDRVMGTNWIQKHEEKAEQEKAEFALQRGETPAETNRVNTVPSQNTAPQDTVQHIAQSPGPAVRGTAPVREAVPVRGEPVQATFLCQHCNTYIPDTEVICTSCGKQVKAACSKCNVPFSVFESTCPNCGFVYAMAPKQ